jgi:hypothetical protein
VPFRIRVRLVFFWTGMPALACPPTRDMTLAEVDCCKKMVGDCHMGPEHHPCCNVRLPAPPQLATVIKSSHFQTTVVFVSAIVPARFIATSDRHLRTPHPRWTLDLIGGVGLEPTTYAL